MQREQRHRDDIKEHRDDVREHRDAVSTVWDYELLRRGETKFQVTLKSLALVASCGLVLYLNIEQ